jgi:hypothetical protein
MLKNDMSKSLEGFCDAYIKVLQEKFSATDTDRQILIGRLIELSKVTDRSSFT